MEIGINLFCYGTPDVLPFENQIDLMKENGFYHTFAVSDNVFLTDEAIDQVQKNNITFDNLHMPFRKVNALYTECEDTEPMLNSILEGIDKCARHGIPLAVVHLSSGKNPPFTEFGVKKYCEIMDAARRKGIKIAFENIRTLGNIALTLEMHEDARFCWDTGHENCFTKGRQYMPLFGARLGAIHIHDNNGIPDKDEHLLPYDGSVDFKLVAKHLANINYDGTLMLEAARNKTAFYENVSAEEYYTKASKAVLKLKNEIEKLKKQL